MSAKTDILNNVLTTLQSITTANGYATNMTSTNCERVLRVWGDIGASVMPWLGFADVSTTYRHDPSANIEGYMTITVVGHVSAATPAACTTQITALEDDLIAAMCGAARQQRGSDINGVNAIGTKVLKSSNDIGAPDGVDSTGGYGTISMDFEVRFMRTIEVTP